MAESNEQKTWVKETFSEVVKLGGKLVSKQWGDARVEVCKKCPLYGMVKPLKSKSLEMPGCTQCGCPTATKPYMKTILFKKIKCPHPEGNKWADVDKQFE